MNVIKNGLKLGVLSMAIFSALGTAHAQDGADDDREKRRHKHKDMEVMVVTASGVAQHIKKAPASISVIDKSELSHRFYKDLTEAMTDEPGVVVTGGGDR